MRLTVIPSDSVIILDGRVLKFNFAADVNLHAIQWYGTHGYIEFANSNQLLTTNIADVQDFINAFNAESSRLSALASMPKPPKTQAEIDKETSYQTIAKLAKLRADVFPDLLAFLATLPGAPQSIKDAATIAAAERSKVKP